jgi:hypothetical protein
LALLRHAFEEFDGLRRACERNISFFYGRPAAAVISLAFDFAQLAKNVDLLHLNLKHLFHRLFHHGFGGSGINDEDIFFTDEWNALDPKKLAIENDSWIEAWSHIETPPGANEIKDFPPRSNTTEKMEEETDDGTVTYYALDSGPYTRENVDGLFRQVSRPGWLSLEHFNGTDWVYNPSLIRYLWGYDDNYDPITPSEAKWVMKKLRAKNLKR